MSMKVIPDEELEKLELEEEKVTVEIANVHAGVSMTWLAENFRMDLNTVKRRLAPCPVKGKRRNYAIYDLAQACPYLIEPKVDIAEYIQSVRGVNLPAALQKDYWDAQLKRLAWEEQAKMLWKTEDVFLTFAEAYKRIKTSVLLWRDTVDKADKMTDMQKWALDAQIDMMLAVLYSDLVSMAKDAKTQNLLQSMEFEHGDKKMPVLNIVLEDITDLL